MQQLKDSMQALCDGMRMLTGLTVAYGTAKESEFLLYGRAQEVTQEGGQFVSCERPLDAHSIYDLASLTKLFTCMRSCTLFPWQSLFLKQSVIFSKHSSTHLKYSSSLFLKL